MGVWINECHATEVTVSALQNRIHKIKAGIALGVKNVQGSPNKNASVDGTNAPVTPKNKGGRKKTTGSKNDKKSAASGRNDGEEKDPGGPRSSESPTTNRSKKRKIGKHSFHDFVETAAESLANVD